MKGVKPMDGFGHSDLQGLLARQKAAQIAEGIPTAEARIDRIDRAIGLLVDNKDRIATAIREDFGQRSIHTTILTDIGGTIASLKHARANLRGWMKPERRRTTPALLGWLGANAEVIHQPKGVVGIISPWNYPVHLAMAPLAGVFSAGCRAMIKPSERTRRTSDLLADLVSRSFHETELAIATGGPEVGEAFAALPFDHLLFTGGASIARRIAHAAAANLVPTTLELGGKSPVVIGRSANLESASRRTMAGKLANAGQMCLAPDYALVPSERVEEFIACARRAVADMYPSLEDNPDYTALIDQAHYSRVRNIVDDALAKGGVAVELASVGTDRASRSDGRFPPTLIIKPTGDMLALQEEIFGPVLPVVAYSTIDDAIRFVEARPAPLGLYYFGKDRDEERRFLSIRSGGATVNDVIQHIAMENLPFGGIGESGMGCYHGLDGFRTFSHAKAVYRQSPLDLGTALRPPYGRAFDRIISRIVRR